LTSENPPEAFAAAVDALRASIARELGLEPVK
jgi:hypothetical protein